MTKKDKDKQAFSVLHTSADYSLEVEKMTKFKKKQRLNLAIAAAAARNRCTYLLFRISLFIVPNL